MTIGDLYWIKNEVEEKLKLVETRERNERQDYSCCIDTYNRIVRKREKLEEFLEVLDILLTPTEAL